MPMLDWATVLLRFAQFSTAAVLFGTTIFPFYAFGAGNSGVGAGHPAWIHRTVLLSAISALIAFLLGVAVQTAILTDDIANALDPSSLWWYLSDTHIGNVYLFRFGVLFVALTILIRSTGTRGWIALSLLGGMILGSFAWTGHGAKDADTVGPIHLVSDVLHLLAAGVWIGALVPLAFLILRSRRMPSEEGPRNLYLALESFSRIGILVVAALIATGIINSVFLIGLSNWRSLFSTAYGFALLIKLALFAGMLVLAAANRFWLSPRLGYVLSSESPDTTLRSLQYSLLTETGLAAAVLAVVALLGTLEPPIASV